MMVLIDNSVAINRIGFYKLSNLNRFHQLINKNGNTRKLEEFDSRKGKKRNVNIHSKNNFIVSFALNQFQLCSLLIFDSIRI